MVCGLVCGYWTREELTVPQARSRRGMNAEKARVKLQGLDAIDRRSCGGRSAVALKESLTDALGGPEELTPQKAKLADFIVRNCLILDCIDAWIFAQPTIINDKGQVLDILQEHLSLTNSTARIIGQLGMERRLKPPKSLQDYVAETYATHEPAPTIDVEPKENVNGETNDC